LTLPKQRFLPKNRIEAVHPPNVIFEEKGGRIWPIAGECAFARVTDSGEPRREQLYERSGTPDLDCR